MAGGTPANPATLVPSLTRHRMHALEDPFFMIKPVPARDRPAPERRNLSPAALYEHAIRRDEAVIVSSGALTAETGRHTGRSPKDKFFVKEPSSQDAIWWHPGNQPISIASFDGLLERMDEFCASHEVFKIG